MNTDYCSVYSLTDFFFKANLRICLAFGLNFLNLADKETHYILKETHYIIGPEAGTV